MDPNGPHPKRINTFGLTDNCYYVTAAKLKKTTVQALMGKSELLQITGGAKPAEIAELFASVGLPSAYSTYTSIDKVEAKVEELAKGLTASFGVAFLRKDGSGHMVVAKYDADSQLVRYRDYQLDTDGTDAGADISSGITFHVFG
jgi:hypothetical protein